MAPTDTKSQTTTKKTSALGPRKSIRYKPDPLTTALIALKNFHKFEPTVVALVLNESFSGSALLVNTDAPLKKGGRIKVQIGHLAPMLAKIVWLKHFEESIYKVGIQILE